MIVRRAVVTAALLLAAGVSFGATTSAADDGAPTVTVDRMGAKAGETVLVRGTGWTGTELVYVELCGNAGRNGTSSCEQGHATLTGLSPDGSFAATLTVANPPLPCPCVIKATSQSTQAFATAPLAVQDVPVVPLEDQTTTFLLQRSVDITDARLTGRGPWTSWFGKSAERTLVLRVANTGDVAVHDPPLTITVGKGTNPTGIVPAPDLGTIEPGESVTVEVPVHLSPFGFGQHSSKVSISGFAERVQARATTSTYPWALLALAAVVVQLGLLRLRNLLRGRMETAELRHEADHPDVLEPARARELAMAGAGETVTTITLDETPVIAPDEAIDDDEHAYETPAIAPDEAIDDDEHAYETPTIAPDEAIDDDEHADEVAPTSPVEIDPAVIDLRPVAPPEEPEVVDAPGSPEAGPSRSTPFGQVTGSKANGSLEMAARIGTEVHGLRRSIDEQRQIAEQTLDAAQALANSILSSATARADEIVEEAMTTRAEASSVLDQARRDVEQLLGTARVSADAIRHDAELQSERTRQAAAAAQAEVNRLVADATRQIEEQLAAVEREALDLLERLERGQARLDAATSTAGDVDAPRTEVVELPGGTPQRTLTGLDSAIERAVHKAFQA